MVKRSVTYVCPHPGCFSKYYRKDRLNTHVRNHTGERPFVCVYDDCDKSFIRSQHLKRHEIIHEAGKLGCTYEGCNLTFKTKITLKKHIDNIHLKKKPKLYKCSYCEEQFNKHTWLKAHEYKHNNTKPYVCPEEGCGKCFLTPSKLKRHQKVHQGYKCFKRGCNVISQTWSLHLKHVKVLHPTVHECPICSKVFRTRHNMKLHQTTHSKSEERQSVSCPEPNCQKSYYEMKNLRHHINAVHSQPFKCSHETCSMSFQDEKRLQKHFKKAHDPDASISSKKRKLKAKRKKKAKLSMAAMLSGFSKPPEHNKGHIDDSVIEATESGDDVLENEMSNSSVSLKNCKPPPPTNLKDLVMIEIFIDKMDDHTTVLEIEENPEATVIDNTKEILTNSSDTCQEETKSINCPKVFNTKISCS